jgi:integrase
MASICKRGDSWWVRIRKKGWPTASASFDTKFAADKWAREIESEMDRGVYVSRSEAESTTLNEALERYLADYIPKLADPQLSVYRARALQKRKIATRFLALIRAKDVADFIKERQEEGVSPHTIRLDLSLLSNLFEIAASDWGMESLGNPVRRASRPKLPPGRERRLDPDEEERLLAECDPDFALAVRFALATAMRRGEIIALEWRHINCSRKTALLPKTKNGEARTVPLSPAALAILDSIPRDISGKVFSFSNADALSKKMNLAARKAGLEDLRFHDLRHEATSRLFEDTDLDVMEIKGITGHKSMQMLARYSHLRAGRLAERLAKKGRK